MLGLTGKYLPSTFSNLYGWIEPLVIIISCQQPTFKDILPSSDCPGNFPQAFSHVALVNTALNLSRMEGPAEHRSH